MPAKVLIAEVVYDRIPNIRPNIRPKSAEYSVPNIRPNLPNTEYQKMVKKSRKNSVFHAVFGHFSSICL